MDAIAVLGSVVLVMQGGIAVVAIGLLLLTRMAIKRDWIA
ncbi:MAG: hypothetical protein ACI9IT_002661 [Glaciecola sp.]